jgi:hypothetical protein
MYKFVPKLSNGVDKCVLRASLTVVSVVSALSPRLAIAACDTNAGVQGGIDCGPVSTKTLPSAVGTVTNTLLWVVGVASVIMLIVGGLRYVLSGGDPKNTQAAKDTILYAVVGIVVALLAYAIANFVLGQF